MWTGIRWVCVGGRLGGLRRCDPSGAGKIRRLCAVQRLQRAVHGSAHIPEIKHSAGLIMVPWVKVTLTLRPAPLPTRWMPYSICSGGAEEGWRGVQWHRRRMRRSENNSPAVTVCPGSGRQAVIEPGGLLDQMNLFPFLVSFFFLPLRLSYSVFFFIVLAVFCASQPMKRKGSGLVDGLSCLAHSEKVQLLDRTQNLSVCLHKVYILPSPFVTQKH